jgi:hypothetical protein
LHGRYVQWWRLLDAASLAVINSGTATAPTVTSVWNVAWLTASTASAAVWWIQTNTVNHLDEMMNLTLSEAEAAVITQQSYEPCLKECALVTVRLDRIPHAGVLWTRVVCGRSLNCGQDD